MCCNEADYDNCKAVFKDNERVTVMEMSINDAWFRDTGATFLVNGKGDKAATDWHFNAYGGLVDGLYFPWDKDAKIARKMADYVGVRTYRPDHVILEGGSITVDGEGTLSLRTRACFPVVVPLLCWSPMSLMQVIGRCTRVNMSLSARNCALT